MGKQEKYVYSLYKPIRNRLRQYDVLDSLHLVWAFARNLTFNTPFPEGILYPNGFRLEDDVQLRRVNGIPEHEQEFLVKEIILNCVENNAKKSLKEQGELPKIINHVRQELVEKIDKKYTIPGDFLIEFHRMAHRQFVWQEPYSKERIYRYYRVFTNQGVDQIIEKRFGMTTYEIMILGIYFFYYLGQGFIAPRVHKSTSEQFGAELIEKFISTFSISLGELRTQLEDCQQINENLFYSYNPLLAKPIIATERSMICPLPLMLYWQTTSGLYYSVYEEKGFDKAFGNSFEEYVGEVLDKSCTNPDFQVFPEAIYGKPEKRTSDWIVVDATSVLFIECKTKRMVMASKTDLDVTKGLEKDLVKMATFIWQLYKQLVEYSKNLLPQIKYDESKKFVPMVLTLENWWINLNPSVMKMLHENVLKKFEETKMDVSMLEDHPYQIGSCEDFERDIQLMNALGIDGYFDKIAKNELHDYIATFEYQDYIKDEFKKIFIDRING